MLAFMVAVAAAILIPFAKAQMSSVIVRRMYVDRQINSMAALRQVLGKPIAVLDGQSLGLPAGTACYGYAKGHDIYVLCPAR